MCLCVGHPDGVQEEHKQFILVRAEECPMSSQGEESCIILHRSACSRSYKQVREGGAPRSQDVSGVSGCFLFVSLSIFHCSRMVPAFPFYRCKGSIGLQACAT
jgi:hypothetical protein